MKEALTKRTIFIVAIMVAVMGISAGLQGGVDAASMKISKKTLSIKAGSTYKLKVKNLKKKKKVKWSSSNKKIATVSKKGTVTAKLPGTAVIKAKVGKKTFKTNVTVKKPSYTIKPSSKPINKKMRKYTTYNSKTKNYYTIRSYMELFEKCGGGTLTLSKGTYKMCTTIYVPSNVTIKLKNGAVLSKTESTGTSKVKPSNSMFMLCAPSVSKKANKFKAGTYPNGYTGYNGVQNVKFIGSGNAVIDTHGTAKKIAIIMGHNQNVTVENITFKNMNTAHFIEIDASQNVTVKNCKFLNGKNAKKEAINLDTPDLQTGGFNSPWSSFDKTANNNITIQGCTFKNLPRAIGTHNYSYNHPHTNINIVGNSITDTDSDAISAMYWKDSTISNNSIKDVKRGVPNRAILCPGVDNLTVRGNSFTNVDVVAMIYPYADDGYPVIYPNVTQANKDNFKRGINTYSNVGMQYIPLITKYGNNAPDWTAEERIPF